MRVRIVQNGVPAAEALRDTIAATVIRRKYGGQLRSMGVSGRRFCCLLAVAHERVFSVVKDSLNPRSCRALAPSPTNRPALRRRLAMVGDLSRRHSRDVSTTVITEHCSLYRPDAVMMGGLFFDLLLLFTFSRIHLQSVFVL